MLTRIFLVVVALAFLTSVVGFAGFLIYQYITAEEQTPITSAERDAERLSDLDNLGALADFEPLAESERLEQKRIEERVSGEEGLQVIPTDVVTIKYQYALAQSGQIIFNSSEGEAGDGTQTGGVSSLCPAWTDSLIGLQIGAQRRLFIPAAEVGDCNIPPDTWPTTVDLVIDIELVVLADRKFTDSELSKEGLADFNPLTERLTELRIEDIREGEGPAAAVGDTVEVNYVGVLAVDGLAFDAGEGAVFGLVESSPDVRGVIVGWVEGLSGMKVGGLRRVFIPAAKAYGDIARGSLIPADSDLVFDVELIDIVEE